jgi:hypothetical protein
MWGTHKQGCMAARRWLTAARKHVVNWVSVRYREWQQTAHHASHLMFRDGLLHQLR